MRDRIADEDDLRRGVGHRLLELADSLQLPGLLVPAVIIRRDGADTAETDGREQRRRCGNYNPAIHTYITFLSDKLKAKGPPTFDRLADRSERTLLAVERIDLDLIGHLMPDDHEPLARH